MKNMVEKSMIEQHKSLAEKFIKKGFWLYLFSFIIGPIGYLIKIIVSNELEVSEVGILYGVISLIYLIAVFNDVGMAESLRYFVPKFITEKRYDKVKSIFTYAISIQIITSIIICLIIYFSSTFIADNYFQTSQAKDALKIFAFYFIGLNIFQTLESFFVAIQDTFAHKIIETLRNSFVLFYVVVLFILGYSSLINFSFGWIIGLYLATFISIGIFYKKYYTKYLKDEKIIFEKNFLKEITKYASLVFLGASASTILSQVDMQMIIYLLGTTDAGYYTNYLSIINIPFLLLGPIFVFLFPVFSELGAVDDTKRIKYTKHFFSKIFIIIGIMFNIFFFVFSDILTYTLFGEKFLTSGLILKYSVLLLLFNFLLQINFNLMAGIGQVKERLKIVSIAIIFNIIMNYILIKLIGVCGASLATGLGWFLIWILSEIKLGKKYGSKYELKPIFLNLCIFSLLGFVVYKFLLWNTTAFSRIESFFLLGLCFFVWGIIFLTINIREFKAFIFELKKLRK